MRVWVSATAPSNSVKAPSVSVVMCPPLASARCTRTAESVEVWPAADGGRQRTNGTNIFVERL